MSRSPRDARRRSRDRRRRAGRPDAGDRPGGARPARRRPRDAPARRAAEREVQPRRGANDGAVPPPRPRRRRARRRPAGRLPERRRLSHVGDRHRALAHPHSGARDALQRHQRPRRLVADARAAAPHQPDLPRADPVRACRSTGRRDDRQPLRSDRLRAGRLGRDDRRARSRQRRRVARARPLPDRLRRRPLDGAQVDRRGLRRHAGDPARAVDLHPRAEAARPDARRARLELLRRQPAPQRHLLRDRRPRDLARPQPPDGGRGRLRGGRSRRVDPRHPRRRRRLRVRDPEQGGLDRPAPGRRPLPRPPRLHLPATPRTSGCPMPATA